MKSTFHLLVALLCCASFLAKAEDGLTLSWTNNRLSILGSSLPTGKLEVLYLEAFCHKSSTERDWGKTVLPHRTQLVEAQPQHLRFRTTIKPNAMMLHEVLAGSNTVDFHFVLKNEGTQ